MHCTFAPRKWKVDLRTVALASPSEICGILSDTPALAFRFLSALEFEEVHAGLYRLTAPLAFYDPVPGNLSVPCGFATDFYSAPRWVPDWLCPPSEPGTNAAAVVHDYLVRNRKRLRISLTDCHGVFLRAMLCLGVPRWKARLRWAAVYAFNWLVAGPGDGSGTYALGADRAILGRLP